MKLRKGTKVEVLNRREVPSGSWWPAEIISGNGHTYSVRYDCYSPDIGIVVDRIPRKAIRPSPPLVESPRSCVPGDIVEVLESSSWKLAEVSRLLGGNHFFVRLLGSCREFRAHASELRSRLSWQDNQWVVINRKLANYNSEVLRGQLKVGNQTLHQDKGAIRCGVNDQFPMESRNLFMEPIGVLPKATKRRQRTCLADDDDWAGASKKMRTVEETRRSQRLPAHSTMKALEKVDAVASPHKMLGEKYMHASLNNKTTGFSEIEKDGGNLDLDVSYPLLGSVETNDTESVSSSVGSCSTRNTPCSSLFRHRDNDVEDDTESYNGSGRELSSPTGEEVGLEIHSLELYAYRCTLLALYATGTLSWEQEELVTNLRLRLHISNDEHLAELKNLMSSKPDSKPRLAEAFSSSL